MLEKHKKLLRNYSQNIDTLEQVAGIRNVIECHGKNLCFCFTAVCKVLNLTCEVSIFDFQQVSTN